MGILRVAKKTRRLTKTEERQGSQGPRQMTQISAHRLSYKENPTNRCCKLDPYKYSPGTPNKNGCLVKQPFPM